MPRFFSQPLRSARKKRSVRRSKRSHTRSNRKQRGGRGGGGGFGGDSHGVLTTSATAQLAQTNPAPIESPPFFNTIKSYFKL